MVDPAGIETTFGTESRERVLFKAAPPKRHSSPVTRGNDSLLKNLE